METESLIPRENIKQEPDYEISRNIKCKSLVPVGNIKQEPDYEGLTVKKEVLEEKESNTSPAIKRVWPSLTSISCPEDDRFMYCEKCKLKYEGSCPEHGLLIYIDNAEVDQGERYSQDYPQIQEGDIKDSQVGGRENVLQSQIYEARIDDVRTLPNGDCSTESDQMFSVYEINTKHCVAGTSCGLQSNVQIKTHLNIHKIKKYFTCDVCGAEFALCRQLKQHKRAHTGEKPYKCDVCGVGFATNRYLKRHKRTHSGEKPYKCDVCGVGFVQSASLKKHKRTHTGEKPYKCDVCGVGFAQSASLKKHKRIHTGEKPYECDVCGVRFSRSSHQITHKRTHTGEKPYKCDVCGAGFAHSSNLINHKRTHTGEKPYKCDVCGVGFTRSGDLKRHKKTHTKEKL